MTAQVIGNIFDLKTSAHLCYLYGMDSSPKDLQIPYKTLRVALGTASETLYELDFHIRNTRSAQIWASCIEQAQSSGLRESDRFYNFPGHKHSELQSLLQWLENLIEALKKHHPHLEFPTVDPENLQKSINTLHFDFAHSVHVTQLINPENEKAWSDFNIVLHALESALSNHEYKDLVGVNFCRIDFTWNQPHHQPMPEECYQDFSINKEFGCVYIHYPHVGRHFLEMFTAKDDNLADEHIQPTRFISADTMIYFGPSHGHYHMVHTEKDMKEWFEKRSERFNRLGHFWGDPKLALGFIPVARLAEPHFNLKEVNGFQQKISACNHVRSARVIR